MRIIGPADLLRYKGSSVLGGGVALAFLMLGVTGCASRMPKPTLADLPLTVARLTGEARWKTGTNEWQRLVKNQKIRAGTVIETAQKSQVDLQISADRTRAQSAETASSLNRTDLRQQDAHWPSASLRERSYGPLVFRIWENTRVAVSQIERSEIELRRVEIGKVMLGLQAGHIFVSLAKLPAGAAFEVRMPTCSASVRGTVFDANVDGIVKVLAGSVLVTGTNYSQLVQAQQMFDARTKVLSPLSQYYYNGLSTFGGKRY